MKNNLGLVYAIVAYIWWGIIPIFWKQLEHVGAVEIVMHRMVWACLLMVGLILALRQWGQLVALLRDRVLLLRLFIASLLMSANWATFIWAVNSGYIVETSLGYFINPLTSVLFGVIFFAERLRVNQLVALSLAALGVVYMVFAHGKVPWVALVLAITFSFYSVVKKSISIPAIHGMAFETLFMFPVAFVFLLHLELTGAGAFGNDSATSFMLILAGLFTLIPLVLFAAAAKKISMTALGMTQYVGPFLQLGIAVLIYKEAFGTARMIAFSIIWVALLIYTFDQLNHRRRRRSV